MKTAKTLIIMVLVFGPTAEFAKADFTFGTPMEVPNVNSSSRDFNSSISADGLSLYFISTRPGGVGGTDIWVATRETTDDPWGTPENLGPSMNTSGGDGGVSISFDDLTLYFSSMRSGGYGDGDLWVATRETIHSEWGTPRNLGQTVNSWADQCYPSISADELALYFNSNRGGGLGAYDLWVTTRETADEDWGAPVNLGPTVNSSTYDMHPGISADGRLLFYASTRSGGVGGSDLWVTSRATTDDPWGESVNIGSTINSSVWEDFPNVSADGSTLFFRYSLSGTHSGGDIWQAPIIPIVDFNSDGFIDTDDLLIMIDNWSTDNSLCDIGPMPWGDGVVDETDLEVLMSYWGQEFKFLPIDLRAYWRLDETEGNIAQDSAGENDGTLYGEPLWQPEGGIIDGALEFDGIDDYISIPLIFGNELIPFSVFAWIKGGLPDQVIFSQVNRSNWLAADPTDGSLMTELKFLGKPSQMLKSQAIITDDQWHRVGLVWDGTNRILYVDDTEVASDAYETGFISGNLQIGADNKLEAGTFWSGLIDDVRICNRAVTP